MICPLHAFGLSLEPGKNILFANKIIILRDRCEWDLILPPRLIWLSKPMVNWQIKKDLILILLPGQWRPSLSQKSVELSTFHFRSLLDLILFNFCFPCLFFFFCQWIKSESFWAIFDSDRSFHRLYSPGLFVGSPKSLSSQCWGIEDKACTLPFCIVWKHRHIHKHTLDILNKISKTARGSQAKEGNHASTFPESLIGAGKLLSVEL